ncbi:uncharacterized protein SCHCODRAFT_02498559 [Schizophyllum commune H4-8]|uniref:F-box domain-containing protein n=1 Tax=Schizophyllum commune (strain H4-8 / FGSC 9210) TaxID=578458 RepID=D8PMV3_SCHCM|nr:uncharacterized protein SCHCODRAFT_02498559 [Schizophyllum commune H4-8]KAI5893039.1 hypothetical protein SCHCODRAFT_02498559 [Schizophyllum commune H4-8]
MTNESYIDALAGVQKGLLDGELTLSQIDELEDRTRQLQESLLRARNIQSPANKLPAEVLASIFHLVQEPYDDSDFLPQWPDWTSLDWLVVTHLHLAVESAHDLCLVCPDLRSPAPKLESLSICIRSGDPDNHSMIRVHGLLKDNFSAVRRLVAVGCPIWEYITFSHLTHLAIYQTTNHKRGIQGLLQNCPDLEELVLTDIWFFSRLSDETYRLPRLQYLQLITLGQHDDGVRTSPLVASLDIPERCRYRVANPSMADVLAVLTISNSPLSKQRIHTANIMFHGHRRMTIHSGTVSLGCAPSDNDIPLVARAVDPDTKLTLVLGDYAPKEELCVQLFLHMRRVRTLVIIDDPPASGVNSAIAEPLVNALGSPSSAEDAASGSVVLPALESLHVHNRQTAMWPCLWSAVSRRAQRGNAQAEVWEPAERPVNGFKWAGSGIQEVSEDEDDHDDSQSDWDSDY